MAAAATSLISLSTSSSLKSANYWGTTTTTAAGNSSSSSNSVKLYNYYYSSAGDHEFYRMMRSTDQLPSTLSSSSSSSRKMMMLRPVMKNVNEGKGVFAPLVVVTRNLVGKKRFNQLRGKAIALHSQVITEFCKSIGADVKQRQGLIRLAKKNGEKLGFLA